MGKNKGSSGKHYISKGERPSYSRKIMIASRAERRKNPAIVDIFKSRTVREFVMSRRKDPHYRDLAEKYIREEFVKDRANDLFEKYGGAGATWAGCVQAVKTDWVSQFETKWSRQRNAQ